MSKQSKKPEENSNSVVAVDDTSTKFTETGDDGDRVVESKNNPVASTDEKIQFELIRKGSASKLRDPTQLVQYELGNVDDVLSLRITSNDKDGLFSGESIPINKIADCLSKLSDGASFSSRVLHNLFSNQSNNNVGFLAAIFRAENVLKATEGKLYMHQFVVKHTELEAHLTANY
ncbi:MAG: hypothetical protein RPR97_00950 [Colwellia sp.]